MSESERTGPQGDCSDGAVDESEISVRLLGTGGPWVDEHRFASATLISIGQERLLVDAGRGIGVRLVQAGENLGQINPIFITHHHLDHISDLADLMITSWMRGRREELVIYGPAGTKEIVDTLVEQVYAKDIEWRSVGEPHWGGWKPVRAIDVEPGLVVDTGRWSMRCEYVEHGHGLGFRKEFLDRWKCLGYRFEADGHSIAISGDTVDCAGIRTIAEGTDILVQCCFITQKEMDGNDHLSKVAKYTLADTRQAATIARDAGVGHLVLTHIRPTSDELIVQMEKEIREIYSGRLSIGSDLLSIQP